MTPFGQKLRQLRRNARISQKQAASHLGVSAAYLCALEHGKKSAPSFVFVQRVISFFNIIWDDADELMQLAQLSHPKVIIDTRTLNWEASYFVHHLAHHIQQLDKQDATALTLLLSDLLNKQQK